MNRPESYQRRRSRAILINPEIMVRRSGMHRVLITGAGGGIGRSLRESLRGVYPVLRLSDRVPLAAARDQEEVDCIDLADTAGVERIVAGVDGIVHLGGISGE